MKSQEPSNSRPVASDFVSACEMKIDFFTVYTLLIQWKILLILCRSFERKMATMRRSSSFVNRRLHPKKKPLVTWSDTFVF